VQERIRRELKKKGYTEEQIVEILAVVHDVCDSCISDSNWDSMGGAI